MATTHHAWTKPFHGVQHLGEFGTQRFWCTVNDYGSFAELLRWTPGCQFSPMRSTHLSAANARAVGEGWLDDIRSKRGLAC